MSADRAPTTDEGDGGGRPQFWIDRDGDLVRVAARLGGAPDFIDIDFNVGEHPPIDVITSLVDAAPSSTDP